MTPPRKTRWPDLYSIAETWLARAFGAVVALNGLGIIASGRYHLRGQVVEDPARVWLAGSLMLAAGVYITAFLFRDRRVGETGRGGSRA
jgi:hypothetical protein